MSSPGVNCAIPVQSSLTSGHVRRCRNALLVALVFLMVTRTTCGWDGWGPTDCKPCAVSGCVNDTNCKGGASLDACGCCVKCLKVQGELCGGIAYRVGRCDHRLYCNITGADYRNPIGKCAPVLSELHRTYVDRQGSARNTIPGPPATFASPKRTGFYVTREKSVMKIVQNLTGQRTADRPGGAGLVMALNGSSSISKDFIHHSTRTAPAITFLVVSGTLLLCVVLLSYVVERRSRTNRNALEL